MVDVDLGVLVGVWGGKGSVRGWVDCVVIWSWAGGGRRADSRVEFSGAQLGNMMGWENRYLGLRKVKCEGIRERVLALCFG